MVNLLDTANYEMHEIIIRCNNYFPKLPVSTPRPANSFIQRGLPPRRLWIFFPAPISGNASTARAMLNSAHVPEPCPEQADDLSI